MSHLMDEQEFKARKAFDDQYCPVCDNIVEHIWIKGLGAVPLSICPHCGCGILQSMAEAEENGNICVYS